MYSRRFLVIVVDHMQDLKTSEEMKLDLVDTMTQYHYLSYENMMNPLSEDSCLKP